MTIPMGYCQCGCGGKTKIAPKTNTSCGWIKGKPLRYIRGHNSRKIGPEYIVDPSTGCWVWQRNKDRHGYGLLRDSGRMALAHRVYYERFNGPIPDGKEIDHLCKNRACVNPKHLEVVSHAENDRRGKNAKLSWTKVRAIRMLYNTRKFTQENLAKYFRVSQATINLVVNEQTWRGGAI